VFNLQGSEIIIILLLALVVLGPEKLPDAMRKAGQFYGELKKMSSGFQSEFRAAVEEPLRELKDTTNTIRDSTDFRKLQSGERQEKPKSAEMLAAADPDAVPTEDLPFRPESTDDAETPAGDLTPVEPSNPTAFSGAQTSSAAPPKYASPPAPPKPFSASESPSTAAPADEPAILDSDAETPGEQTEAASTDTTVESSTAITPEHDAPVENTGDDDAAEEVAADDDHPDEVEQ